MRLIKPSYKIIEQEPGSNGVYKMIEYAGRICYKSSNKITEDSAKPFVDRMIKSGHGAMLEHGTVYLQVPNSNDICLVLALNPYTKYKSMGDTCYATTNLRVLVEHDALWLMKYQCEPTEYHERRVTVHFVCDRGVSHEFVRHRVFSFAQESTRYCNYSKDKFGNQITFIQPSWITLDKEIAPINELCFLTKQYDTDDPNLRYLASLVEASCTYVLLLNKGWTPQQARAVLPNSLKTELVMTGFVSDWKHFFRLRSRIAETGKPHPQAQELADPLMDEFVKRGIMETLL